MPSMRNLARTLAIAETIMLLYLSILPAQDIPGTGIEAPRPGDMEHFLAYAIYGLLLAAALPKKSHALMAGTGLGVLTEAMQFLVPTRLPDPVDILVNSLGVIAGLLAYRVVLVRKSRSASSSAASSTQSGPSG